MMVAVDMSSERYWLHPTVSPPRLHGTFRKLASRGAVVEDVALDLDAFTFVTSEAELLIHKSVTGCLRIPDFDTLTQIIRDVYAEVLPDTSGENAQYIPQLAEVDPDQFVRHTTSPPVLHIFQSFRCSLDSTV
jgi:hypothetical protein